VSSDGNNATLFPGLVADWTTQGTTTAAERPVTVQQPEGKARGAHDLSLPEERYRDIRLLGVGGAGEVRQVLDRTLNRLVAVKTLRSKFAKSDQMMRRFIHEAQIVAQLEHPGIVPVHDLGRLPDGTWFLTMTEIKGQDLDKILRGFHKQRREERGPLTGIYGGWTIRRFIDTLRIICGAVGFAHTKGVIHRDLKPENVMIGDHGEIRVVDWGLAKIIGSEEREEYEAVLAEGGDNWAGDGPAKTRYGVVAGTPAYMPPEQAAGRLDELGPPSDVWALGGMLYSSLYGRLPYRGGARAVIELVQKAPPDVPEIDVPGVLVDIWRKAMSMDPAQRYPDANALGADLEAYIEGSLARERALKLLASARDELREELPRARAKARQQRNLSRQRVQLLRPTDDLGTKEQAWRLEEEAAELQDEVEQHYRSVAARARAALAQVPDLPEARALLADLYRERAEEAEAIGHQENAREYRALLAEVDDGRHADFLRPVGHLHLETEPSGVEVLLYRFVQRARRLHPEALQKLRTPIRELELPEGSYLAVLKAQDHEAVRYPFQVERGGTWSSKEPGEDGRSTVRLPARGSLGGGDRYVAGGWVPIGGDSNARASLGRRRVWVSSFVLRDRPVTHGEYLAFLNDLAGRGHGSTATALCPRIEGRGDEAPRGEGPLDPASRGRGGRGPGSGRARRLRELVRGGGLLPLVLAEDGAALASAQRGRAGEGRPRRGRSVLPLGGLRGSGLPLHAGLAARAPRSAGHLRLSGGRQPLLRPRPGRRRPGVVRRRLPALRAQDRGLSPGRAAAAHRRGPQARGARPAARRPRRRLGPGRARMPGGLPPGAGPGPTLQQPRLSPGPLYLSSLQAPSAVAVWGTRSSSCTMRFMSAQRASVISPRPSSPTR
jgi:serine/threonine protein kinase